MQITRALFNRMVELFATNDAVLGTEDPNQIQIEGINVPFTPGPDLTLADVPKQGSPLAVIKVAEAGAPLLYNDLAANARVACFVDDGAAYKMLAGSGTFPFTIYGTRLVSQDGTILYATEHLVNELVFTADGDGIDVPKIQFTFPYAMVR